MRLLKKIATRSPGELLRGVGRRFEHEVGLSKLQREVQSRDYYDCSLEGESIGLKAGMLKSLEAHAASSELPVFQYLEEECSRLEESAERKSEVLQAAEKILAGHYWLNGAYETFQGEVDWLRVIGTSKSWPLRFAFRYSFKLRENAASDFRLTWELNRHQHLIIFGLAYRLTGNSAYSDGIIRDITSWVSQNPPFSSLNWSSVMELSIRVTNWILSLLLICSSASMTKDDESVILTSLYQQLRAVMDELAVFSESNSNNLRNNHIIVELCGVFVAAGIFPFFPDIQQRVSDSNLEDLLVAEVLAQTHPDGMNVEQSSNYLRFVTEAVGMAALCVDSSTSERLAPVLASYADILRTLQYDKDRIVLFGDEDNGHFASFLERQFPDWVDEAVRRVDFLTKGLKSIPQRSSHWPKIFRESGHYVHRFACGSDEFVLYFRCGVMDFPHLPGYAPHVHADQLHFSLFVNGEAVFVDSGTFSYVDTHWRKMFRSTEAHNSITLDGLDQVKFTANFGSAEHSRGRLLDADGQRVVGKLDFAGGGGVVSIVREIEIRPEERKLSICDEVVGAGIEATWNLNVDVGCKIASDGTISRSGRPVAKLNGIEDFQVSNSWVSDCYSRKEMSKRISFSGRNENGNLRKRWEISLL